MRRLHHLAICILALTGCNTPEPAGQASSPERAVVELNRQIEKFNAARPANMGIVPIAQRVSRLVYAVDQDSVSSFDESGTLFLVLTRQPDGQFKGSLKVKYHELPKPEGHSWGEVVAEFTLPEETFQDGARTGASRFAQRQIERHQPSPRSRGYGQTSRRLAPVADPYAR